MKIVIIGNGASGTAAANSIRNLNKNVEITIISDEEYFFYFRPRLPEIISKKINLETIQAYKNEWYQKRNIQLLLNTRVLSLNLENNTVITNKNSLSFDKLILATGAKPNLPNIPGINSPNIFTLRTLEQAINLSKAIEKKEEILLLGGGLLGLEIASHFCDLKKKVKIIEINNRLLPRFLSEEKSLKLQQILKPRGFEFIFEDSCLEVKSAQDKLLVYTQKGQEISSDLILVSAGVSPQIQLAKDSGLKIDKGILVNSFLQTSHQDIYAVGDCIQLENKIWGFMKSALEQGKIAGENLITQNTIKYPGTEIEVVLKISDLDLKTL